MTVDYLHPQEEFLRTLDIKTLLPQQPRLRISSQMQVHSLRVGS